MKLYAIKTLPIFLILYPFLACGDAYNNRLEEKEQEEKIIDKQEENKRVEEAIEARKLEDARIEKRRIEERIQERKREDRRRDR